MATIRLDFADGRLAALQRARLPQGGLQLPRAPLEAGMVAGQGVSDVGRVVTGVTAAVARAQDTELEQRARLAYAGDLNGTGQALELGEEGPDGTRRMLRAADMPDFFERRRTEARQRAEALLANAGPEARRSFAAFAEERDQLATLRATALRAARQNEEGQAAVGEELRTFARQAASARAEPERLAAMAEAERAIELRVQSGVLSPTQGQRLRTGFLGQVDQAAALRLIQANPGEAARRLSDEAFLPNLDPIQRERLFGTATSAAATAAARAEAAAARRERAVLREMQEFNGLLQSGIVPEERAARVLDMARGTEVEPAVRQAIADGRSVQAFVLAPLAERQRMIAEADARRRGPNATDADQAQYGRLVQAQQNILTGFQRDGLGFAVQLGLVPPQPPIDWTDPATLNSRAEAAAGVSAQQGYAISPFNREDLAAGVEAFTRGTPEQRLAIFQAVAGIADPQVRAAAFRGFENARGDAGRMPPGIGAHVVNLLRDGAPEAFQAARRIVADLGTDVSDRARQAGESAEMRAALVTAQGRSVQAARVAAARIADDPRYAALLNTEMEVIQRMAAVSMASGETSATRAVESAQRTLNTRTAVVNDPSLAVVTFPAGGAQPAQITAGLRLLRAQAAEGISTDPSLGADQALEARALRRAAERGVWVNSGNGNGVEFQLVVELQAGIRRVLARAPLAEVVRAADGQARRDAERAPVMRREDTLEQTRRDQRGPARMEPVDMPAPTIR